MNGMSVAEAVASRRSIRAFTDAHGPAQPLSNSDRGRVPLADHVRFAGF